MKVILIISCILIHEIGGKSRVSEILNRKRRLTKRRLTVDMIRKKPAIFVNHS
jgi:antitoxin component HigA of HigAB toxin-antitoxin module